VDHTPWEHGLKLMDKSMRLNPHHPGWYHIVPFMNYYRQGEYELALIEARRFNPPRILLGSAYPGRFSGTA
jgi:hypothetical protein